jgi:hypothetical protein
VFAREKYDPETRFGGQMFALPPGFEGYLGDWCRRSLRAKGKKAKDQFRFRTGFAGRFLLANMKISRNGGWQ